MEKRAGLQQGLKAIIVVVFSIKNEYKAKGFYHCQVLLLQEHSSGLFLHKNNCVIFMFKPYGAVV